MELHIFIPRDDSTTSDGFTNNSIDTQTPTSFASPITSFTPTPTTVPLPHSTGTDGGSTDLYVSPTSEIAPGHTALPNLSANTSYGSGFPVSVFIGSVAGSFVLGILVGVALLHSCYRRSRGLRDWPPNKVETSTSVFVDPPKRPVTPELELPVQLPGQRASVARTSRSAGSGSSRGRISRLFSSGSPPSESTNNLLRSVSGRSARTIQSFKSSASATAPSVASAADQNGGASAHTSISVTSSSNYSQVTVPPYTYDELFTIPENYYHPPGIVITGQSPYDGLVQRPLSRASVISDGQRRRSKEVMADDSPTLPPCRDSEIVVIRPYDEDLDPLPPPLVL